MGFLFERKRFLVRTERRRGSDSQLRVVFLRNPDIVLCHFDLEHAILWLAAIDCCEDTTRNEILGATIQMIFFLKANVFE